MRKETICQTWRLEFSTECKSELETLGFFDSVNSSRSSSGSRDYQLLEMSYAGLLIFCFILITILSIMYYYAHFKQKNQKLIANQLTGSGFKVRCVQLQNSMPTPLLSFPNENQTIGTFDLFKFQEGSNCGQTPDCFSPTYAVPRDSPYS